MTPTRILCVDDEIGMLEVCHDTLAGESEIEVVCESSSLAAAERLRSESWDLLITDLRMPGLGGLELLKLGREHDPDLAVMVITGYPSLESAVATLKLGGVDYLAKPFHPDDLRATVLRLIEARRLRAENRLLARQLDRAGLAREELTAQSSAMRQVMHLIERVAPTDVDVLITGETGTGKELVARTIHRLSARRNGRFVPVNCGAIPEPLMESELFGYERGAFTGADRRTPGLLEYASGGTLFLDEIAELPLGLQAKLLRALQERRIRRLGGREELPVDLRVIAATARDLQAMLKAGNFRDDLYWRIHVVEIPLPALRNRRDDIVPLANVLLRRHGPSMGKPQAQWTPAALDVLLSHDWPGNVRELENVTRRALAMARGERIDVDALPDLLGQATTPPTPSEDFATARKRVVDAWERRYLHELLTRHGGRVVDACTAAGLSRATFYRLVQRHSIDPDTYRSGASDPETSTVV